MATCSNNKVLFIDHDGQRQCHSHDNGSYLETGRTYDGFNMSGDFSDIEFKEAILVDSNMKLSNFENAELVDADLRECNFEGANLRNADLSNADLRNANLTGADLSGAILDGADLTGVNLDVCKSLRGISIDNAKITYTKENAFVLSEYNLGLLDT